MEETEEKERGCPECIRAAPDYNSESQEIKVCVDPVHNWQCISRNNGACFHDGPCDPMDRTGRHFKPVAAILDADIEQARQGVLGAAAAIDNTPFADSEPFNPAKTVRDLVGS